MKIAFILFILYVVTSADDLAVINSIRKLIYDAGFKSCASLNSLAKNTKYTRQNCGTDFIFTTEETSTRIAYLFVRE